MLRLSHGSFFRLVHCVRYAAFALDCERAGTFVTCSTVRLQLGVTCGTQVFTELERSSRSSQAAAAKSWRLIAALRWTAVVNPPALALRLGAHSVGSTALARGMAGARNAAAQIEARRPGQRADSLRRGTRPRTSLGKLLTICGVMRTTGAVVLRRAARRVYGATWCLQALCAWDGIFWTRRILPWQL